MLRLLFLIAATLAGLFFLAITYESGEFSASNQAQSTEVKTEGVTTEAKDFINDVVSKPESTSEDVTPAEDIVQAEAQTPEQVQKFPGPALRPSPEYAGETPEPETVPDSADGQILYVTAERVNFRAGPSTNDRVIGGLDGGAAVVALGPTDTEWVNIRDGDGRVGYLSGQFLSAQAPN